MIHYSTCPVCESSQIKPFTSAKDYTVTGEIFDIWKCHNCLALFTQGAPSEEKIGGYYASEDYISHSDTKEGLVNKLYHFARAITLNSKRSVVRRYTGIASGNILDVGCGTGAFLAKMREAGWTIKGLEPDTSARANAMKLHGVAPSEPGELFQLPSQSFDAITLWHVLEHVHRLHDYMSAFKSLLRPKGRLFIAVPNYTSADAGYYKENWAAFDVPRHLYHFSPQSINILANKYGMKVEKTLPMWFDSYYVSMLSEKYRGKENLVSALIQGTISNAKALTQTEKCSSVIYVLSAD